MPANLRIGIPGALQADEDQLLWAAADEDDARRLRAELPHFAIASGRASLHPRARNIIQGRTGAERQYNARQFINAKKVAAWLEEMPHSRYCQQDAPSEPNAYEILSHIKTQPL